MSEINPLAKKATNSKGCNSYSPGQQVHWIQARVKADKPRFDAQVQVLSPTEVRVSWLDQELVFKHHNTAQITKALDAKVLDYLKIAPDANLLYIQTEEPNDIHKGAFSLFYLSSSELEPCKAIENAVDVTTLVFEDDDDE